MIRSHFYFWQTAVYLLFWWLVQKKTKKHLYQFAAGSVQTRPPWMSQQALVIEQNYTQSC